MEFSEWQALIPPEADLHGKVAAFLRGCSRPDTWTHVEQVARVAVRLARADSQEAGMEGDHPLLAEQAGLLHDISAVIPNSVRLETARRWGLAVLPEEAAFPMLLHQGLSAVMARWLFGIKNPRVLSAIGCHTTLRAAASRLDKILFVADKLAWDQAGPPPYLAGLQAALERSLDEAALFYLEYLRDHLTGPLHPWARAALAQA